MALNTTAEQFGREYPVEVGGMTVTLTPWGGIVPALRNAVIGIRRALGAQSADILRLIVRQGVWLAGLGLTLGLLAAFDKQSGNVV
ncbi:MAG: hypothetical protein U0Y68_27510 [Blastocatellia bacterium]